MTALTINLVFNQQQLELLDNSIAQGVAPDRESLIRLALREFAARHDAGSGKSDSAGSRAHPK
jgi:hypothetical protein